jgi:hypothetical protein
LFSRALAGYDGDNALSTMKYSIQKQKKEIAKRANEYNNRNKKIHILNKQNKKEPITHKITTKEIKNYKKKQIYTYKKQTGFHTASMQDENSCKPKDIAELNTQIARKDNIFTPNTPRT